ncbi:MAG: matrixin family metalloprotease [Planctomycetota bacterium]
MYVQNEHLLTGPISRLKRPVHRSLWPRIKSALDLSILAGVLATLGCGNSTLLDSAGDARPTLGSSVVGFDRDATYYENTDNDLLELAQTVDLSQGSKRMVGSISGPNDTDVFNLGPVSPGDHITVVMETDETLDGAIALLDQDGTAWLVDDHRNVYLGRAEPFIDVVVQRTATACHVAVSATPGYSSDGDYTLIATKQSAQSLPERHPDTVLLDFDGGRDIRVAGRPTVNVPPFDAEAISAAFADDATTIANLVTQKVRTDYADLNVTILSTSEGDEFDGTMTRVFFGTFDADLLGIAQGVDEFNSFKTQSAMVFTDTFRAFAPLAPSVDEISQAIANVASHEIGHLLGLVHTADPNGLMDVTASLAELLSDQNFRRSPIHQDVFPLGYQDEFQYLLDSVGASPTAEFSTKPTADREPVHKQPIIKQTPARQGLRLGTCDLCRESEPRP